MQFDPVKHPEERVLLQPSTDGILGTSAQSQPTLPPYFEQSGPAIDAQELRELSQHIRQSFTASLTTGVVDFAPSLRQAIALKPELEEAGLSPAIGTSLIECLNALGILRRELYYPEGVLFHIDSMNGLRIYEAEVSLDIWQAYPYLNGTTAWTGSVNFSEVPDAVVAVTLDGLGFVDRQRAADQSRSTYQAIQLRGPTHPIPSIKHLSDFFRLKNFTEDQYCYEFGVRRIECEELQHARDKIFLGLQNGSVDPALTPALKQATTICKPDSALYRDFLEPDQESNQDSREVLANIINECSGRIGGVALEVEEHLRAEAPNIALAAFLDFLAMQSIFTDAYERGVQSIDTFVAGAIMHLFREIDLSDENKIIHECVSRGSTPGEGALSLLREVYALNFYTDSERERLV